MEVESYKALAIRYRPSILADLIGHKSVVTTISNSINMNRFHHAIMLTGTRGVGKTTIARIMAISLNCTGKNGDVILPTTTPCLECDSCTKIISSSHPDIIEFDAASRTGVDSIREIIENCIYPPMSARYKVYIIDEVHMLSKGAFNALLKTIEEPHQHLKFIFATTELKKVPVTVLSRCQKFVLRNLHSDELAKHLSSVCLKEGFVVDEKAIEMIATFANGSVRDALSILDQVLSMTGNNNITYDIVREMLSIPEDSIMTELLDAILSKDIERSLDIALQLSYNTQDIDPVVSFLMVNVVQLVKRVSIAFRISDSLEVLFIKHKSSLSVPVLMRMWQVIATAQKASSSVSFLVFIEMLVIQLIYSSNLPTPKEVIDAIAKNVIATDS